ncbi:MAG TPA: SRPBCC domain-containing protein, partial [Chryseosolibacter sp.]
MRKIEVTIAIDTLAPNVISAFTDPVMLREWWQVERTLIEKKVGGIYTLAWNISEKGFGFVSSGVIKEYRPESLLVIRNFVYMNPEKELLGPMTLTVRVTQTGTSSSVYICQDGYQHGT